MVRVLSWLSNHGSVAIKSVHSRAHTGGTRTPLHRPAAPLPHRLVTLGNPSRCVRSVEQLKKVVDACPSLRLLHADCRTKGTGPDQLDLFTSDTALRPHKLVVHRASPLVAEAEASAEASSGSVLGAALQQCKESLVELDTRNIHSDEATVADVSSLVASSSQLRRLIVPGSTAMRREGSMEDFAKALSANEHLEELQLGCSCIGSRGADTIATAIGSHPNLRSLELQHNPLLDAGAASLGRALHNNRSLRHLAMPFTGLGDGGCAALALALRHGSLLDTLDLSGNSVSADGVQELCSALPHGAVTTLCLSANNKIGPRGAIALAAALPETRVATLRLDGCALGPTPCGRLAVALTRSAVACLDLSANEIGDLGAWELAWRLPECAELRELRLAVNEIEEDGASELLTGLLSSTSLTMLDLRGNRLDKDSSTTDELRATQRANVHFQRSGYVLPTAD